MSAKVFIAQENLGTVLDGLSRKIRLWVPASAGEDKHGVEFVPYRPGLAPVLDRQSTILPKKVMLPQVEKLFSYEYLKNPEDPSKVRVKLEEPEDFEPTLVFGAHPCDVKGFFVFDRVFTQGPFVDGYYKKRRENTLFATVVCQEADSACFCSSVGSGPADQAGSDFWIMPVEGGYVVEALTDRALPFMDALGTAPTEAQETAAKELHEQVARQQVGNLDLQDSVESFKTRFEQIAYWQAMAGQCLSCGICTYVCPTCYCFTISDEMKGLKGERLRSWDSCMFCTYTAEASGHNPRPTKLERYRNRVGHKFSYFPEKYDGMIACCGCGRCIRSCPVSIDIRKVVQELKENACVCA